MKKAIFLSLIAWSVFAWASQISTKGIADQAVTNAKIANSTISLTTKVTGVLPVANGGTNLSSTTVNQLLYSSATNTIAGLATANKSLLVTDASGVPSISNQLPIPLGVNVAAGSNGVYIKNNGDTADGNLELVSANGTKKYDFYSDNVGFFYLKDVQNTNYVIVRSNSGYTAVGGTGSPDPNVTLTVNMSADKTQLAVRGNSTQTSNLQIWETSGNTVLAKVDSTGLIWGLNGVSIQTTASQPSCSSTNWGLQWVVRGNHTTTADQFQICMENATGTYEWVTVVTAP